MENNQNINQTSFILGNELKNISSLIPKLKLSLKLQKEFIKEIENNLQIIIGKEEANINTNPSLNNFINIIPYIIKELGISFSHFFLLNINIYYNLILIYFDKKGKNDLNLAQKITHIFQACIDVFKFIF